jgi:hypothetical protein
MRSGSLLSLAVAGAVAGACAAPTNEPVSARPRDPVVRTGTRLPCNNCAMTGHHIDADEFRDSRTRQGQGATGKSQ